MSAILYFRFLNMWDDPLGTFGSYLVKAMFNSISTFIYALKRKFVEFPVCYPYAFKHLKATKFQQKDNV